MRPAVRAQIHLNLTASADDLWPYVADTDRIDRASGLPRVHFNLSRRADGGETAEGEYRLLGVPVARWTEHPFEWDYPRHFAVLRDYQSGPLLRFHGGTQLLPLAAGGTRLRSYVEITPRFEWLEPVVRYGLAPLGLRRAARLYRSIDRAVAAPSAQREPLPPLARLRSRANVSVLNERIQRVVAHGGAPEPAEHLGQLLATAPDEDVFGMRPLELARRWRTDPRATLDLFIRATVAGVLELRWELLCPRCRGAKASVSHLRELASGGFCPTCNLHFFATVDEAIEARFYTHPSIRTVELGTYCIGSPMKTPHRVLQAELAAGASRTWQLGLQPGTYMLTSPQSRGTARVVVGDGAARGAISASPERIEPDEIAVASGPIEVSIANASAGPMTLALDDVRWEAQGATPGCLMTLPAFRTFLSSEALAPGFELAVGRVGLLFTDLAGSTALYERIGDARAFKLVGEHFGVLTRPIERHGGALVKTIGDAIMAAFPDGRAALAAALAMQRAIRDLDVGGVADVRRLVKVGVHVGACYAVTLNDRLDYFGSAVNLAARAQNEAQGGEIVLTEAALEEGQAELDAAGSLPQPFEVQLKGFEAPVRLFRIDTAVN